MSAEQRFAKAIATEDLTIAVASARQIINFCLYDALRLTLLVARCDRRRYPDYARRWLGRWIKDNRPDPTRIATLAILLAQAPNHRPRDTDIAAGDVLTNLLADAAGVKQTPSATHQRSWRR